MILPSFSQLNIITFADALTTQLQTNLEQIDHLLCQPAPWTWDSLMRPLDDMDDQLERFWSPLAHLHAVVNSPALRICYEACLPKLAAYESAIGHNHALYHALLSIDKSALAPTQEKILKDTLRDFELSGVALPKAQQHRFEAIQTRLSDLSNQFENNVLDASQAYTLSLTDPTRLRGLPEHALQAAQDRANIKKQAGWILNLEFPCYIAVMTYADDRTLREALYEAYVTRASDEGPSASNYDNSAVMDELLALRHEKATLLGFPHYAALSLATKMADSSEQVMDFLTDLRDKAHAQALQEFGDLEDFATKTLGMTTLEPWDILYVSEKKKQALYAFSEEDLRPYFPLPTVMTGLFSLINKLYGMTMTPVVNVDVWHKDATCYCLKDETTHIRGYIYLDLFARQNKRGGAWMDSCQSRRRLTDGTIQLPIAFLTCNFAKTAGNQPPTLSHDEVVTLFHEFGHCLHHVLTQVDYLGASGIHGVEWDAVELPSQFFENWCWEASVVKPLLTAHVTDGTPIPSTLFKALLSTKNFQSAMAMMRQVELSLFDFRIHKAYQPNTPLFISTTLADVRKTTTIVPIASYNRFQHSFSHIFGGGYAAGYYSYKWAEVLSSDAFSRFEEEGILNETTGRDFLHRILEIGGSQKALQAFIAFRGRAPTIDALLKHNGIL